MSSLTIGPTGGRRMRVDVTQHMIDRAVRQDSSLCVVATAIAHAVDDAVRIMVDTQLIRFTHAVTGQRVAYLTPGKVQAYVIAFDAGDPIPPFSFWLNDPIPMRQRALTDEGKRRARERARAKSKRRRERPQPPTVIEVDTVVHEGGGLNSPVPELSAVSEGPFNSPSDGPTAVNTHGNDAKRTPPLVFKQRKRTYGLRALRINQKVHGRDDARVIDALPDAP